MYSSVYVLLLVLFYVGHQVEGSCVACAYMTSKDQCLDPFTGSYNDVCNLTKPIDMTLCRKYDGGYTVYCGTSHCERSSSACKDRGSCVACAYMTSKDQCLDPFTGSYNDVCNLTKPIDMTLSRKYGGGYTVYCGSSHCERSRIVCKAGSIHHAYPAVLLLAVFGAIVTAK